MRTLRPDALRAAPERATLAVLDAALDAARNALLAENPELAAVAETFQGRAPPLYTALAILLVARADELRDLLDWYLVALDELHAARGRPHDDLPF